MEKYLLLKFKKEPLNLFIHPVDVINFLDLTKNDVSKAFDVPKHLIKYNNKAPKDLLDKINEMALVCELVTDFFDGNKEKAYLWFQTRNTSLGNVSPRDMIRFGKFSILKSFIFSSFEGDTP